MDGEGLPLRLHAAGGTECNFLRTRSLILKIVMSDTYVTKYVTTLLDWRKLLSGMKPPAVTLHSQNSQPRQLGT